MKEQASTHYAVKVFGEKQFEQLSLTLSSALESLQLNLSVDQQHQLLHYLALFYTWNKTYNLSAIRDAYDMLIKHLIDSLSVVAEISKYLVLYPQHLRWIDVGTGGGLPGVPLAIVLPNLNVHLLDSAGKKMRFLFQVKQSLSLKNIEIHNIRVESYQPDRGFDGVLSRAFASLPDMVKWCDHLLSANGAFWAMKGVFPQHELSEIEKHYKVEDHKKLAVPGLDAERCLIRLCKTS